MRRLYVGVAVTLLCFLGSQAVAQKPSADDTYVVILTGSDSTSRIFLQRYPEISATWQQVSEFNLLRPGTAIEVPRDMFRKDEPLAKVADFFGEAEIRRALDSRFIPVLKNVMVRDGDVLRTWRRSGARLVFDDGSYVFLRSNTKVKVVVLGTSVSKTDLSLSEGSIDCRVRKGGHDRFEIQTPTASTLIRGTDFRLKVESGDATRLEVLDGVVELHAGGGTVEVPERRGALSLRGEALGALHVLPDAPQLLREPLDREVLRAASFDQNFTWAPVAGAASYRLEIARDETFFDVAAEEIVAGSEARTRVTGLEPGTYFWRVSANGTDGFEGPPSSTSFFVFVRARP